jgi:hypothetical protein
VKLLSRGKKKEQRREEKRREEFISVYRSGAELSSVHSPKRIDPCKFQPRKQHILRARAWPM